MFFRSLPSLSFRFVVSPCASLISPPVRSLLPSSNPKFRSDSLLRLYSSSADTPPPAPVSSDNINNDDDESRRTQNKNANKNSKQNRRDNIGKAKAVDRGQYQNRYVHRPNNPLSGLPDTSKPFTVLGIETSCDDTGVAVVESTGKILGESIASQAGIHENFGGIVPGLAKEAHAANIQATIADALDKAGMDVRDVDAIAVTVGPGLEICLRVGCEAAKTLAIAHSKPFVGVHHLEAHILMSRLNSSLEFPFLSLLVSGGHCQLLRCDGIGSYEVIGGTLDDSLGEAYDKVARMLNLPVGGGGGPAVEALAKNGDPSVVKLPIPMQHRKDCDFSFAGLKNAFRMAVNKMKEIRGLEEGGDLAEQDKADLAASFQNVAIKHLEQRLKLAISNTKRDTPAIDKLVVVGGVAANKAIRESLSNICEANEWNFFVPEARLCTDNGVMAAWAGIEKINCNISDVPTTQEVFARYPFSNN
ncbi:hypothetical protein TrVE_jg4463 [Triparma verrucosa]|uniref:N(6)-L-threonylcarbamoyladenine synthase n=1 Tax=Triparma verrucosa TaxID=1606542 RepID=A0A9W7KT13_9STRA|nr:hypothetical protein TrVE_jg4463 [Triparma verrucosa]